MPNQKDEKEATALDMSEFFTQQPTLIQRAQTTPAANFRLQLAVPTYEGHTDKNSVADFLQEMQDYRTAEALTDEVLLQRILPVALTGSAARWWRRQTFLS